MLLSIVAVTLSVFAGLGACKVSNGWIGLDFMAFCLGGIWAGFIAAVVIFLFTIRKEGSNFFYAMFAAFAVWFVGAPLVFYGILILLSGGWKLLFA